MTRPQARLMPGKPPARRLLTLPPMVVSEDVLIEAGVELACPPTANDVALGDWDEQVRQAFFAGCLGHEIRAEVARRELVRAELPPLQRALGDVLTSSSRAAREAWAAIDRCLAVHGELAALALDRCVEETSLQLRRPSGVFRASPRAVLLPRRARSLVAEHHDIALSIIDRARERLIWFRARRLRA